MFYSQNSCIHTVFKFHADIFLPINLYAVPGTLMSYCSSERYNVLVTSSYERAVILRVYHFMSAPDLNIDGVMTTLFSNTDNME